MGGAKRVALVVQRIWTMGWRWLACACLAISTFVVATDARALDPTRSIDQFYHTAWTQRDGVPGNIIAIAQTTDGFLWLGTAGGLYRFVGVRVQKMERFGSSRLPIVSIRA